MDALRAWKFCYYQMLAEDWLEKGWGGQSV
jgi:hypothetical protein